MHRVLIVALATCACRSSSDQPAQPAKPAPRAVAADAEPVVTDKEMLALIDRLLTMQEAMVAAAERAGSDCARMANSFAQIISANADLLDRELLHRLDPVGERFDQLVNERRSARYTAVRSKLVDVLRPCADDPAVTDVLKQLDVGEPPPGRSGSARG